MNVLLSESSSLSESFRKVAKCCLIGFAPWPSKSQKDIVGVSDEPESTIVWIVGVKGDLGDDAPELELIGVVRRSQIVRTRRGKNKKVATGTTDSE